MERIIRQSFLRGILIFSVIFIALLVFIVIAANVYFPDMILDRYISKSRLLAKKLSRSIQDVRVFGGSNHLIKKIVRLNFPQEENVVHIVVRDKKGTMTYQNPGSGEKLSFADVLKKPRTVIEEVVEDDKDKVQLVRLRGKKRDVLYYKISSPIYRNGIKVGDVSVGISKRLVSSKIELNKGQLQQIAFIISLGIVAVLVLSYFISIRFFLKFKRSELKASQLKHMAYVGELSSGLAHEIRNPLNTMSINLQLLKESIERGDTDKVEKKLTVLEHAKDHAANVLTEFMNFAKYKKAESESFDLLKTIKRVASMLEEGLHKRGITLILDIPPAGIKIKANEQEISQVVFNLMLNSMESMDQAEERILRVEASAQKKDLILTVEDTGAGMDEFTLSNMFTPFFSKKKQGTGLGMAMVKRVIDEHSGTITPVSEPGKGTRINIRLEEVVEQ